MAENALPVGGKLVEDWLEDGIRIVARRSPPGVTRTENYSNTREKCISMIEKNPRPSSSFLSGPCLLDAYSTRDSTVVLRDGGGFTPG